MKILAIIGTAGRDDDFDKLDYLKYKKMVSIAKDVVKEQKITHLVSGGAAWADHVALSLCGEDIISFQNLTLFLPRKSSKDYSTMNFYWEKFYKKTAIEVKEVIDQAIKNGATVNYSASNFQERNTQIADLANVILAYTFGTLGIAWSQNKTKGLSALAAGLKQGGTYDTWDKSKAKLKIHVVLD